MAEAEKPKIGAVTWRDLTVKDAERIQKFYCEVVGWKAKPHEMGEYHDFDIIAPDTGEVVAGICHARDSNARLPPQWLIYITVKDADASAKRCVELGGKIIDGPRPLGQARFCVIQDPAGAVAALYST